MKRRIWTEEDDQLLLDYYGNVTNEELESLLGRTTRAINQRVAKIMTTSDKAEVSGNYRLSEIANIIGVPYVSMKYKLRNNELCKSVTVGGLHLITYDDFWNWIKGNMNMVKPCNVNIEMISTCPEWYKKYIKDKKMEEKELENKLHTYIKSENERFMKERTNSQWSSEEEEIAYNLRLQGFSYVKIAEMLNRTPRAVQVKLKRKSKDLVI